MLKVWCVLAEFGKYAQAFLKGGYAAIGWIEDRSLADCKNRDDLQLLYRAAYPQDTSNTAIPFGGQGAFITTADFQRSAFDVALEYGFPQIGLINGEQLVDLLVEHWDDIPSEFQDQLSLKRGLVLS